MSWLQALPPPSGYLLSAIGVLVLLALVGLLHHAVGMGRDAANRQASPMRDRAGTARRRTAGVAPC